VKKCLNSIKENNKRIYKYFLSVLVQTVCMYLIYNIFGTMQCDEYRLALLHAIVREIQILMFLLGMRC